MYHPSQKRMVSQTILCSKNTVCSSASSLSPVTQQMGIGHHEPGYGWLPPLWAASSLASQPLSREKESRDISMEPLSSWNVN